MKEIGEEIKRARLAKGVNLEEIVNHTHIQLAHLQKIENGQFDFLPRPYVTAFIKTFAQHVGLNGDQLIQRWREQEQAETLRSQPLLESTAPKRAAERTPSTPLISLRAQAAGTAAPALPAIPYLKEILLGLGMVIVMAVIVLLMSRSNDEAAKSAAGEQSSMGAAGTVKEAAPAELRDPSLEQISQQMQKLTEAAPEAAPPAPTDELVLLAQLGNQTRMRVVRDGRDTTYTSDRNGEIQRWQTKEKFDVRISPGGVVTLTLNGKSLGEFSQAGRMDHRYLTITREGVIKQRTIFLKSAAKPRSAIPLDSMTIRRPQG
jgi:cytoskeletal protein RodZ